MRLLISVLLVFVGAQNDSEECGDLEILSSFCETVEGSILRSKRGSFCQNSKNKTVGASFSFCENATSVDVEDISILELLDFRTKADVPCPLRNNSDLANALQLSTVTLRLDCTCPGALTVKDFTTNSTKTFAAWEEDDHISKSYRQCEGQASFCAYQKNDSPFNNYTCPENSQCVDAGPGVFNCQELVQLLKRAHSQKQILILMDLELKPLRIQ
ncbi:Oidioi.mRNA.OKI2018_I69.XSR.g13818.t1.cds [Oikopleura dioica]|uniref:Oidioi.mRNA.OKI2018_I69.XSR.g13818.t1.cds n=1 Tax=Oikopleura dioica TaxID=34765 RepID=A0ABN7SBR4_OIKDI|nr:Oidioi.mRNA.OKI2018_I69.XSR.g13818.t1.cds [Oikopleura dioica]